MAGSFLSRWFGGPRAADSAAEAARAELGRLAEARPDLLPALGWLRELLPDLAPGEPAPPPLAADRARSKLREGTPLLRDEQVTVEEKAFRQRWQRACAALEAQQPDGAAAALGDAVRSGRLGPEGV